MRVGEVVGEVGVEGEGGLGVVVVAAVVSGMAVVA